MNSDSVVSSFCSLRVHVMNHNEDFVGEPLYLAGSFNNWAQEHQLIGKVPALGQSLSFLLEEVPAGSLELKLSRGDWGTVAVSSTGEVVNLFEGEVSDGMNLSLRIDAWWDQFPVSTASAQVHVLDSYFFFPQLNRYRKVWIYLPLNYREGEQQYPVIYMHDGQHLFDQQTAKGRSGPVEWQVDETIDGSNQPCIVVAIDHADSWEQREQEYRVHNPSGYPALGWLYLHDVLFTLKPFIDANYRTMAGPKNTAMAGSSLGALVSVYGGLRYPEIIGHLGILSPSLWMDSERLIDVISQTLATSPDKFDKSHWYFYVGGMEIRRNDKGEERRMVTEFSDFCRWLESQFPGSFEVFVEPEAKHGPAYWQSAFREFYKHLENSNFFK